MIMMMMMIMIMIMMMMIGDKDPLLKKTSFTEPGARRKDIIPIMDERRWVETETGLIAQM